MERTPGNHWEYDEQQARNSITDLGSSVGGIATSIGEYASSLQEERRLESERDRLLRERRERERRNRQEVDEYDSRIRTLYRTMLCRLAGKPSVIEFCRSTDFADFDNRIIPVARSYGIDDECSSYIKNNLMFLLEPNEIASIPPGRNLTVEQLNQLGSIYVPAGCPMYDIKIQHFGKKSVKSRAKDAKRRSEATRQHYHEDETCCLIM